MKLQTTLPIKKEALHPIDYASKIGLLGSCFSEHIGNQLAYYKFQCVQNPFGIIFHPIAIETLITHAINKKVYTEKDLVFTNERWHCFDAHSQLSAAKKELVLHNLNEAIEKTNELIQTASHIIITLGTAWVYRHIETDTIVANCHKVSQKKFLKELLSVDQISESLAASVALLKSVNPNLSILFTVSPIRHLKDGFIENTQSKAHLISAVQELIEPRKQLFYFPSYEIMMDELRDYRFYAEDMIHPNKTAIRYIWERFREAWICDNAIPTLTEIERIQKEMAHKPFHSTSGAHQQFLAKLEAKKAALQAQFPHIIF